MRWNVFFAVVALIFLGAFIGMEFGFIQLVRMCPSSGNDFSCIVGWVAVVLSILTFGSFALPMKSPPVLASADVGPMGFQIYMSVSIVITSALVLITQEWSFTWLGTASAALWVPTSLLSLVAVKFIGISVGQSIWAGITVIISFIWGVALFGEHPASLGLALLGLVMILAGIVGLSVCNSEAIKRCGKKRVLTDEAEQLLAADRINDEPVAAPVNKRAFLFGFLAALGCGITNGTMLVPAKFAAELNGNVTVVVNGTATQHFVSYSGQGFIVSFGIGVAIVTTAISIIYYLVMWQRPVLRPSTMALPAMTSGVMWSIGNYGSVFAAQYLGLAVGFSLTQTALLVGGIWGLTLLREIRGVLPIALWIISALVLLGGAALLAIFG
jgi:glucose uptake protein GlcU